MSAGVVVLVEAGALDPFCAGCEVSTLQEVAGVWPDRTRAASLAEQAGEPICELVCGALADGVVDGACPKAGTRLRSIALTIANGIFFMVFLQWLMTAPLLITLQKRPLYGLHELPRNKIIKNIGGDGSD
jgi:hypothetical protein